MKPSVSLDEAGAASPSFHNGIALYESFLKVLNEKHKGFLYLGDKEKSTFVTRCVANFKRRGLDDTEGLDLWSQAQEPFRIDEKRDAFARPANLFKTLPGRKNRPTLSIADPRDVYEPLMSQIVTPIRNEVLRAKGKIKNIFLVGEFASSIYLRTYIKKTFPDIKIILAKNL